MNDLSPEVISSVVGSIYQAAYDTAEWQTAVEKVHGLLNCSRTCIALTDTPPWKAISTIADDEFHSNESYAAHMRDPYAVASLSRHVGEIFRRHEIVDEAEFKRRELWNDWMMPRDMWRSMTCNLQNDDKGIWSVHVHRGKTQPEFDENDVRALRILAEHMMRAKDISDTIHHAARFGKLFEQLPIGVMLVDRTAKVDFINNEAERLLSRSAFLGIRSGRIFCANFAANAKLAALVNSAMSVALQGTRGGTFMVQGEQEAGLRSIVVSVAPFNGPQYFGLPSQPSAIIILRDVFLQPSTNLDLHMRELFGLTAAEASLCIILASGITLQDAAARNGITTKTARTYLERIFSKTGTRQQSQLVALIKGARPLM
jgi:DNA-binding CsgD family transcriptional regulator/PAS domain-containing protein